MTTKFKKDDLVRVHATRFNAPNGGKNDNGLTFSENWEKEGKGEWCHGRVTFVYKKKGGNHRNIGYIAMREQQW